MSFGANKLLPGEVIDPLADELDRLRNDLDQCRNAFTEMRQERDQYKSERDAMIQAVSGLRRLLAPIWGEVQGMSAMEMFEPAPQRSNSRFDAAKKRMPGKAAELIDLLLEHGPLTVTNIKALAKWGNSSVYDTCSKLMRAGIVVNNGGKYTLKES